MYIHVYTSECTYHVRTMYIHVYTFQDMSVPCMYMFVFFNNGMYYVCQLTYNSIVHSLYIWNPDTCITQDNSLCLLSASESSSAGPIPPARFPADSTLAVRQSLARRTPFSRPRGSIPDPQHTTHYPRRTHTGLAAAGPAASGGVQPATAGSAAAAAAAMAACGRGR
jgi:hypothetical protein